MLAAPVLHGVYPNFRLSEIASTTVVKVTSFEEPLSSAGLLYENIVAWLVGAPLDDGMLFLGSWEDGSGSTVELIFTAGRSGLLRGVELSSRALMGTDGLLDKASIFTALDLAYRFRSAFTSGAEAGVIEATTVTDESGSVGLRREVFYGDCNHRRR